MIGILGAGGEVGRATARLLDGRAELRLGGRRDHESLDRFCAGCDVVVNCTAAPARELVAAAAMGAGAHYVDPAGDGLLLDRMAGVCRAHPGRTALLAAGASPGLTGLLPRWLAGQGFDRPLALTGYACAMDRFSPGSAADFLASLGRDH